MRSLLRVAAVLAMALVSGCDDGDDNAIETDRPSLSVERTEPSTDEAPAPESDPSTPTEVAEANRGGNCGCDRHGAPGEQHGCGEDCECGRRGAPGEQHGCGGDCECGGHGGKAPCSYLEALRAQGSGDDGGEAEESAGHRCPYAEAHPEVESPQAE